MTGAAGHERHALSDPGTWYAKGGLSALDSYLRILSARVAITRSDIRKLSTQMTLNESLHLMRAMASPIEEVGAAGPECDGVPDQIEQVTTPPG